MLSNSLPSDETEARYFRILRLLGVGYKAKAEADGRLLCLKLGYSHEVELPVPPAVRVFSFKPDIICCAGIDKARTHQFAAALGALNPMILSMKKVCVTRMKS